MVRDSRGYIESLRDGRVVYYRGRRVMDIASHEVLGITVKHSAKLFDLEDRIYEDPNRGKVSKYFKVPRGAEDLLERHRMIYQHTIRFNGIFNIAQAIGSDALFALLIISRRLDSRYGTDYHSRVRNYYEWILKEDPAIAVAQTDVKGDRVRRPHEQRDPDLYLRIVEVRDDGVVVKGAKAHTTQSAVSNEIIVLPSRAMLEGDRDYAIAFAVPANTRGLKFIIRPMREVEDSEAMLSKLEAELESITVFDHVFVPWDRVFLFREFDEAGPLANLFATYHRFTAISYRAATANLYLGAALLTARANGIESVPHVRDWIVEMIMYKEIMRMGALSAALEPIISEGVAIPNPVYTNVAKLYSNANFPRVIQGLIDVAGGIIATMPSIEDLMSEEVGPYLLKYLSAALDGGERFRILGLTRELAASHFSGYLMTLFTHAEGSVAASKLALLRDYNTEESLELVTRIINQYNKLKHIK